MDMVTLSKINSLKMINWVAEVAINKLAVMGAMGAGKVEEIEEEIKETGIGGINMNYEQNCLIVL